MSHPYHHALSSVKSFGGVCEDYLALHKWLDCTKAYMADVRHRALRHHTLGIFECEREFGEVIVNSDNKSIPVRIIAEQHILEDLGTIPTPQDWLKEMRIVPWMAQTKKLSLEIPLPKDRKVISNASEDIFE